MTLIEQYDVAAKKYASNNAAYYGTQLSLTRAFMAGCVYTDPVSHKEGWNQAIAAMVVILKQDLDGHRHDAIQKIENLKQL